MPQHSPFALGSACGSKCWFRNGTCDQAVEAWVWPLLRSHPPTWRGWSRCRPAGPLEPVVHGQHMQAALEKSACQVKQWGTCHGRQPCVSSHTVHNRKLRAEL